MRVEARVATCSGDMPGRQMTTAWPSMSMPRRPARPVSWVYSPGVMSTWDSPLYLVSFSRMTGFGGEDQLDEALGEEGFDNFLEEGQ